MVQHNKIIDRAHSRKEWQSGKLRRRTNGINAMDVARVLSPSLDDLHCGLLTYPELYSTKFFKQTFFFFRLLWMLCFSLKFSLLY